MTWTTQQRSDFGKLRAIHRGKGPVVLLLHGVGLQADAWAHQISALADAGHHVIAPDMPGHGESVFHQRRSLADYADTLVQALQDARVDRCVLCGHSMGAMLAFEIAKSLPEKVAGIMALNAVFQRGAQAQQAILQRVANLDSTDRPQHDATLERWFGDTHSPEREACEKWLNAVSLDGYRQAYRCFAQAQTPAPDLLATMTCPAVFMTGAGDPNSTPKMACEMAALTKRGRHQTVEQAAHMLPMTHPAPVNHALLTLSEVCLAP